MSAPVPANAPARSAAPSSGLCTVWQDLLRERATEFRRLQGAPLRTDGYLKLFASSLQVGSDWDETAYVWVEVLSGHAEVRAFKNGFPDEQKADAWMRRQGQALVDCLPGHTFSRNRELGWRTLYLSSAAALKDRHAEARLSYDSAGGTKGWTVTFAISVHDESLREGMTTLPSVLGAEDEATLAAARDARDEARRKARIAEMERAETEAQAKARAESEAKARAEAARNAPESESADEPEFSQDSFGRGLQQLLSMSGSGFWSIRGAPVPGFTTHFQTRFTLHGTIEPVIQLSMFSRCDYEYRTYVARRFASPEAQDAFKLAREAIEEALPAGTLPDRTIESNDLTAAHWARFADEKSGKQVYVRRTPSRDAPDKHDVWLTVVHCRRP